MFCPNCGNKLDGNEDFCSNCGTNLIEFKAQNEANPNIQGNINQAVNESNSNTSSSTMTEQFSRQSSNFIRPIIEKIKNFVMKYKKQISISLCACFVILVGILLFNKFYDFTKISWDKENGDYDINYTEPTTLTLNVLAYDKEENPITDIKFSTESGELTTDGNSVKWKLPNKAGTYNITATTPSGKSIKKEVKVLVLEDENKELFGIIEEVNNEQADSDKDGLTNAKEKEIGTNPLLADTDRDGISDYYEINETKTDPLKKDTDNDGLNDGDELDLGLDPLKKDSKGDGIKDGERKLSYTISDDKKGVTLEINGKGNIASTTIDIFQNSTFSNIEGLIDKVYNFYSTGTIDSATVKINYSLEEIRAKGLNEDNLTLYYFNEDTKKLESLKTTVDKENKQIIVTLKHFSKYVIGDKNIVLTNYETEVMFVIDNSVSMYSKSQMIEAGYNLSTGAVGNDINFKRLALTNNMVDMFTGNYKFGVAEFSGNYVNLKKFTDKTSDVKKAVNSMKSNWNSNTKGTNIVTALTSGIKEFSDNSNSHYLILLTDGKNTGSSLSYNKNIIISNAKNSNVKVCVIGLGSEIDTDDLREISESTGCNYYNASNASALDEIYSLMGADINYNLVDTDEDSETDGMIQADSGFIANRDGFSFKNYIDNKSDQGHCYGMATFAMLYYTKKLPMSLDYAHKHTIFKKFLPADGYDLTNTYFSSYGNLYDFKTQNTALTYYLYNDSIPSTLRDKVENDTWMLKQEYYDLFENIGTDFINRDYNGNDREFSKYQSVLLNISNDKFKNNVSKDERELLKAIYRLFILQVDHKTTGFGADPDKAFEELNMQLKNGVPVVLNIGGHAINAIRLIQDNNDSNKFKLEVYDNNRPGETKYIEITRSKYNKFQLSYTAWTNEYEYSFKYDKNFDGTAEDISLVLCYPDIS